MRASTDSFATVTRRPTQQRARARFERILSEAETILREDGLQAFSIPVLAQRLGYTRGSVYAYFPTPYALLGELAARHLAALEAMFGEQRDALRNVGWRAGIGLVADHASVFYNAHPVASLLLLGGGASDTSLRAQEETNKRLGDFIRGIWSQARALPVAPPDLTTLAADIGTAVFRRSWFEHGRITTPYRDAAVTAMVGFLEPYVQGAARGVPRPSG